MIKRIAWWILGDEWELNINRINQENYYLRKQLAYMQNGHNPSQWEVDKSRLISLEQDNKLLADRIILLQEKLAEVLGGKCDHLVPLGKRA